jgi:hypothetical protein
MAVRFGSTQFNLRTSHFIDVHSMNWTMPPTRPVLFFGILGGKVLLFNPVIPGNICLFKTCLQLKILFFYLPSVGITGVSHHP